MDRPALSSVMLGTRDPERLREWYMTVFEPEVDRYGWLNLGSVKVLIDGRDDVSPTNPEPGRVVLNVTVADAHAAVERLNRLGVTWLVELEEREHGWFSTLIDPDGNHVQVLQMKKSYLVSLR